MHGGPGGWINSIIGCAGGINIARDGRSYSEVLNFMIKFLRGKMGLKRHDFR